MDNADLVVEAAVGVVDLEPGDAVLDKSLLDQVLRDCSLAKLQREILKHERNNDYIFVT